MQTTTTNKPNAATSAAHRAQPAIFPSGAYYVASKTAMLDTLFKPLNGRTADGFYKLTSGGVRFYNAKGEPFAFLVANRHNEHFFVSCSRDEKGRIVYAFALSSLDDVRLGLGALTHSQAGDFALALWEQLTKGGAK